MNFFGYKRPDGRVGVRNKVLILPASVCASDTTRIISQQVVGSVTFNNQLGCSQVASDQQFTMDVMAGYAANPNVYGTVVVSLGCENCQMDLVVEAIKARTNKPLKQVIIQEAGGTLKAIDMAVRYAKEMVEEASLLQKEEFPMSELIIGTECGGSDPTSGLAANPRSLAAGLNRLRAQLKLPERLSACGVEGKELTAALDGLAEAAQADLCAPSNPRPAAAEDLKSLLRELA